MMTLKLDLLGGFQLLSANTSPLSISIRKSKALLAYLALQPEQNHARDKLAALLWEDSDNSRARHSLRQALADLRRCLPDSGENILSTDGEFIRLQADAIAVDALQFQQLLKQPSCENLETAIALYNGELLEGFNPRSAAYEEWMFNYQYHLREQAIKALENLLTYYIDNNTHEAAIRTAIRLLAIDPLKESIHRALMALYMQEGQYTAAIKQYTLCKSNLLRELNIEPEPETQQLHDEVLFKRKQSTQSRKPFKTNEQLHRAVNTTVDNKTTHNTNNNAETEIKYTPVLALRHATILVITLPDFSSLATQVDPEQLHSLLQSYQQVVEDQVKQHDGMFVSSVAERMVILFGASKAYGNETERSLSTAYSIQTSLANLSTENHIAAIQPGIGIASGSITINSLSSHNHTVLGEAVTQATQLALAAKPCEILIAASVYTCAKNFVNAEAIVNNKNTDDVSWRILSFQRTPLHPSKPLVGRHSELQLFCTIADICQETTCGQTFLVRGDAGIGKSRLTEEFIRKASEAGYQCHAINIYSFGLGSNEDSITSLIRSLLEIEEYEIANLDSIISTLVEKKGLLPEQQMFVYDLLGLPIPDLFLSAYNAMDNATRQYQRQNLLAQLVTQQAEQQPQLLLVEDIHWADSSTLSYLSKLASIVSQCPALLVMTTRFEGEPLDPSWRGAMQGAPLTTIDLSPLKYQDATLLAQQLIEDTAEHIPSCVERAAGNPLFLEQLLYITSTQETGFQTTIPDSVQNIVWARLDQLSAQDRYALQAASVLGQRFALDALRHLLNDEDYQCASLIEARFLAPDNDRYRFSHALILECIYASLLESKRKSLHRQAAEYFAKQNMILYAKHLDCAQAPEAAMAYLAAARQEANIYHYDSALELIKRGLELSQTQIELFELHCYQAKLFFETGLIDKALSGFAKTLEYTNTPEENSRALIGQASALAIKDLHNEALGALQEAEKLIQAANTEPDKSNILSQIHYYRGNSLFPLGQIEQCLQAHSQALDFARHAASPFHEARALSGLGDAFYQRGQMITAHKHFGQCVALSRQRNFGRIEVSNLAMQELTLFYQNKLYDAIPGMQAAIKLATQVGDLRSEILAHNVYGILLVYQAEWDKAAAEVEQAVKIANKLGATLFEAENLCMMAVIANAHNEQQQAETLIEHAWQIANKHGRTYVGPWILAVMAWIVEDGDKQQWALLEGEACLAQDCVSHNYLHFYQLAIEVALARKEWDRARAYTETLKQYTQAEPLPWSDFYITRGLTLADIGQGSYEANIHSQLENLCREAKEAGLFSAMPAIEEAMQTIQ